MSLVRDRELRSGTRRTCHVSTRWALAKPTGIISAFLLVPHVAAEIVIGGNVGGIALDAVRAVMAGRQDRVQERALMGPRRLRLGAAVAPRHGVIEQPCGASR